MLLWTRLEFRPDNATSVPEDPGVYALVLEHNVARDLPAAFPMYSGMSDARPSEIDTANTRDKPSGASAAAPSGRHCVALCGLVAAHCVPVSCIKT